MNTVDSHLHVRDLGRAAYPGVYAKVSGLYPAGDPSAWRPADLRPVLDTALAVFGARRLMLGGDWPISVLAGGYGRVWSALTGPVDALSPAERDALRGGTATTCYQLEGVS